MSLKDGNKHNNKRIKSKTCKNKISIYPVLRIWSAIAAVDKSDNGLSPKISVKEVYLVSGRVWGMVNKILKWHDLICILAVAVNLGLYRVLFDYGCSIHVVLSVICMYNYDVSLNR